MEIDRRSAIWLMVGGAVGVATGIPVDRILSSPPTSGSPKALPDDNERRARELFRRRLIHSTLERLPTELPPGVTLEGPKDIPADSSFLTIVRAFTPGEVYMLVDGRGLDNRTDLRLSVFFNPQPVGSQEVTYPVSRPQYNQPVKEYRGRVHPIANERYWQDVAGEVIETGRVVAGGVLAKACGDAVFTGKAGVPASISECPDLTLVVFGVKPDGLLEKLYGSPYSIYNVSGTTEYSR